MTVAGFHVSGAMIVLGTVTGMVYGVSAAGLVLVYRSSKLINFAHGQIGTLGAAILGLAAGRWGLPYWGAFVIALAAGGAVGSLAETAVARRLREAPVIVGVVATLGLAQVLGIVASLVNSGVTSGSTFPQPPGLPTASIGALYITPAYSAMLVMTPLLVLGLTVFLRRSRTGLAMRAAASNPDTALMSGIISERMSTIAWALAAMFATFTAILVLPTRGYTSGDFLGPGLLLRALVCAVIARMVSLPLALVAGVVLGIVESLLLANYPNSGLVEAVIFVILLVVLLLQRARAGRSEEKGSWAAVTPWGPLPESYRAVFSISNLARIVTGLALAASIVLPFVTTNATALVLAGIAAFTLVAISAGLISGLAGQLSLGQFALAGVGATVSVILTRHGLNFVVATAVAASAAAATSLLLGLPALRVRGLMLAVTSLAFALAAEEWLLNQRWMLGSGRATRVPAIGSMAFDTGRKYYFVALAMLSVGLWLAGNVWRSGIGRRMRAVRDNEDAARAFGVTPARVKLQAFVISGFLAGLGGVAYGTSISLLSSSTFPLDLSIGAAGAAVVGGLGVLIGPLLGTLYIIGFPRFVPLDSAELAATALGWLLIILQFPGGIVQALGRGRDGLIDALARRAGLDPAAARAVASAPADRTPVPLRSRRAEPADFAGPALEARNLTVRYGGLIAVREVSLVVGRGEIVGLIGPNGAGKTTLFETLSGFVRPASGSVGFAGRDVTRMAPERRAQLGLIRSFQDAALFPTLSVLDVVAISLERVEPSRLAPSLLGVSRFDRRKRDRARDLVATMGLDPWRHVQVRALSTGTRRIVEIACLVAAEPVVLLLDEPTSGIAQRESEALGELLATIAGELGLTLAVIEHDIPLVTSLATRIVAMEAGRVIADGAPAEVCSDPRVIASYLGEDRTAIERSDHGLDGRRGAPGRICGATTRAGTPCRRPAATGGHCALHQQETAAKG